MKNTNSIECLNVAPTLSDAILDDKDDDSFWQQEELLAEQRDQISDFKFPAKGISKHYRSPTTAATQCETASTRTKMNQTGRVFAYEPQPIASPLNNFEKKTLDYWVNLKCQEPIDQIPELTDIESSKVSLHEPAPKKLTWLKFAFCSMLFFWIFNYTTAIYTKDTLTGKMTNSFFIGFYLMIYQLVMINQPKLESP